MIEIKNLSKTFKTADSSLDALKNVSLTINDGDIYGIIGMSGAGKSTLVRCINMLERPTEGQILIDGVDMGSLSSNQLRDARRNITMIFQGFNLLMQRNCLKNICFPLELEGMKKEDAKKRALELLEIVGLPDKAKAYPAQLSGGQQQRIAIARALATNPKVLLRRGEKRARPEYHTFDPQPHKRHKQKARHNGYYNNPPDERCRRDLQPSRNS